jgi:hypothetical protein
MCLIHPPQSKAMRFSHERPISIRSSSDLSTESTHRVNKSIKEIPAPEVFRRVRFQEEDNCYYPSVASFEERQKLWYTTKEYASIKKQLILRIKIVQNEVPKHGSAWFASLEDALHEFSQISSVNDIVHAMVQSKSPLENAEYIGIEKWVLPQVIDNKMGVREKLVPLVVSSGDITPGRLRKMCREYSRLSRLFATFVAVKSAES